LHSVGFSTPDRDTYLPVLFDQPPHLLPRDAAQATDYHEYRAARGSLHARGSRARPRIYAPEREREPGRASPEYPSRVRHSPHESLQVRVAVRISDNALVIFQSSADALRVSEVPCAQCTDR
jgi:hypothetical protein